MDRPIRTLTPVRRTRTSFTHSRITASIRIFSGWLHFAMKMNADIRVDRRTSIERGNYSYTFQLQGDIHDRLFYTLGGGLEDNGLFGIAGTPRASLAWQVAQGGAGNSSAAPSCAPASVRASKSLLSSISSIRSIASLHFFPTAANSSRNTTLLPSAPRIPERMTAASINCCSMDAAA